MVLDLNEPFACIYGFDYSDEPAPFPKPHTSDDPKAIAEIIVAIEAFVERQKDND